MTTLAGDTELRRLRVDALREERLRSPRCAERGLALRRMARHADRVPTAAFRNQRHVRRVHHRGTAWNPAIVCSQTNRGELAEETSVAGRVPVNLLMMRPGRHHNLSRDARWRCALRRPSRDHRAPPKARGHDVRDAWDVLGPGSPARCRTMRRPSLASRLASSCDGKRRANWRTGSDDTLTAVRRRVSTIRRLNRTVRNLSFSAACGIRREKIA